METLKIITSANIIKQQSIVFNIQQQYIVPNYIPSTGHLKVKNQS